jgi:hypothetical protein
MLETRVSTLCSGCSERKEGTLIGSVPGFVKILGCFFERVTRVTSGEGA